MSDANPTPSAPLPAWHGKLPGCGDFAHRRLPAAALACWDDWLQREFACLRQQQPDWADHYLSAPIWGFELGSGVLNAEAWIGVLMPSVDRVGRYYPLAVLQRADLLLRSGQHTTMSMWWSKASAAAVQALEQDLDAEGFEAALAHGFAAELASAVPAGFSRWQNLASDSAFGCHGLPTAEQFALLFNLSGIAPAAALPPQ